MIDRRHFMGAAGATAATLALGACARSGETGEKTVRYWGMGAADKDKDEKVAAAFKETPAGKGVNVVINQVPSNGVSDMSQIITAVRGGTAPDVWWMDRFNAVQNASIGLIEPLDPLIEKYEDMSVEDFKKQWIQFAVDELTYDGTLYGLPTSTDARGILYNEEVIRGAGLDLDMFDPTQHNLTWDEMRDASQKCVKTDAKGNYEQFGWVPWRDEGWAYTWGFGLGAEAYDNSTSQVVLENEKWMSVYQMYKDWTEDFPYATVDTFFATYQPPNAPPAQSVVFSGRLAMVTTGPWQIQANEKYAPDLPLKWTYLPVAAEGDPIYTWSGGQSLVIPKGTEITKTIWEYMKFHAGFQGQAIIQPMLGNLPTNLQAIEEKKYNPGAEIFRQMLPQSTSRPPLPTGAAIWDALDRSKSSVLFGSTTPEAAVATNQAFVAPKMELFPGYKMPETYGKPSPVPDSATPVA